MKFDLVDILLLALIGLIVGVSVWAISALTLAYKAS